VQGGWFEAWGLKKFGSDTYAIGASKTFSECVANGLEPAVLGV